MLGSFGVLACGPTVGTGEGETDPTAATETSGSSTSGSSSSGAADGSSGSAAMCESYVDEADSASVPLVVVNGTDGFLMLEVNCGLDYLRMDDEMGGTYPGDFCSTTCEDEFEFGCIVCEGCATDSYRMVAPGETHELQWPGRMYERLSPPRACFSAEACGESCQVVRSGEGRGTITAQVTAVLQADCEALADDPTNCICDAEEDCGFQNVSSSREVFPTTTVETSFSADVSGAVLIEFG